MLVSVCINYGIFEMSRFNETEIFRSFSTVKQIFPFFIGAKLTLFGAKFTPKSMSILSIYGLKLAILHFNHLCYNYL